jgi:pimeloyl-ACP methyl ester carboxylesterase
VRKNSRKTARSCLAALVLVVLTCAHQLTASADPMTCDFAGAVDIGGGRQIYMECQGSGSPAIVFISGKGTDAADWSQILDATDPTHDTPGDDVGAGLGDLHRSEEAVLPSVARFSRVYAYDRPDTRWVGPDLSTPRSQPHSLDLDVADLRALLTAAEVPEPYVLVSHSYGGLIATLYARQYPKSVAGMVMVDAAGEEIESVISPAKLANWNEANRMTSAQVREGVEVSDAFQQIRQAPPMPKVPIVVLVADKPYRFDLLPPEATQGDKLLTFADWLASQDRMAAALGCRPIKETKSGHHIYLYSPRLVIEAIRQVVDEVR